MAQLMATSQSYPRFGFRRAAAWLSLGPKRVRRLWRQLGLQLPRRRPRRRRCGSDIRLPGAPQPNSVWTYDFVFDQTANGRTLKLLCVLDEHTRECLTIEVHRWIRSQDVILTLSRLMRLYGKPQYIRSDHGAEFTAAAVMRWLRRSECRSRVYRTWKPLAKRLCRELQRQAARRMLEPRVLPRHP